MASEPSSALIAPDFAALLDSVRGIRWPARFAVRGGIPGAHTSRMRGISAEFTEYRPYRQGDDLGRIDWKLFARSDGAYIRLSNDRAILPTMIVLDASASMAFPVETNGKWHLASQLAVGLAMLSVARVRDVAATYVEHARKSIRRWRWRPRQPGQRHVSDRARRASR